MWFYVKVFATGFVFADSETIDIVPNYFLNDMYIVTLLKTETHDIFI